jgi:hypothetical protein
MPGFVLHKGALVQCAHLGRAEPILTNPRVKVSGQRVATQAGPWRVSSCVLPSPPAANGPCLTALWSTASLRVRASGLPVLLFDSQASCLPTGTPLVVVVSQLRVRAQ